MVWQVPAHVSFSALFIRRAARGAREAKEARAQGSRPRRVTTDYCKSCNDTSGHYAEWIWRFLIVLENEREGVQTARSSAEERVEAPGLPVLVCDEEAVRVVCLRLLPLLLLFTRLSRSSHLHRPIPGAAAAAAA